MATRFYLPISGTPPLASLAVDAQWELTDSLARLPCYTTKQNTALTQTSANWSAALTQQWCWRQWQSAPMTAAYDWTTSDTVSMVIKVAESIAQGDSHLAYVIRVVSGDGASVRGRIGGMVAISTEYPTSLATIATRIHAARTDNSQNFSSQVGDRIIIEIGHHGVTPDVTATVYHNYGDPSATSDYALTAGLTTDLCPWVELSRTVSFGTSETVTAVVANSPAAGLAPTVIGGQSNTVTAVIATCPTALLVPSITGGTLVTAVVASATSVLLIPDVSGEIGAQNGDVTAVLAVSPASAISPTVTGIVNGTVIAVLAASPANAIAPTVTGIRNDTVISVLAISPASALVPEVGGICNQTVIAVLASSPAAMPIPSVTGVMNGTVVSVLAVSPAEMLAPTVTGGTANNGDVIAVAATSPAAVLAPAISGVMNVAIVATLMTCPAEMLGPIVSAAINGTVQALPAGSSALVLAPEVTGSSSPDGTVAAVIIVAIATMQIPDISISTPGGGSGRMFFDWRGPASDAVRGPRNIRRG